jgi:hypothetical protein
MGDIDFTQLFNGVLAESLRDAFTDGEGTESADAKVELASIVFGFTPEQAMATLVTLIEHNAEQVSLAAFAALISQIAVGA